MGPSDLVRERLVDAVVGPAEHSPGFVPRRRCQLDSRVQQRFGIGFHPGPIVAMVLVGDPSGTKPVGFGVRTDGPTE